MPTPDPAFRQLQQQYLREAISYYRNLHDDDARTSLSIDRNLSQANHRMLKSNRRNMNLKRLNRELMDLQASDFSRSSELCDCRMESPHYKLIAERKGDPGKTYVLGDPNNYIIICPISLAIQWTRLNLTLGCSIDFDVSELIVMSKG